MASSLSISFWAIGLVHLALIVITSDCYVLDPRNSHFHSNRGKSSQILSASKRNGENSVSSKTKIKPKKCPPNTRCPDYPSFALNDSPTRRVSFDDKRERRSNDSNLTTKERLYDVLAPSSPLEFDFLISGVRDSNRRTRLLNRRSYTAREPFEQKYINEPPCLNDLKPPPSPYYESLWISVPYRIFTFAVPYFVFPYLILFFDNYVTMESGNLADITSKFGPGVSILYGTFISLTLSILYERQRDIQNDAAVEASLLALITRNLLSIFRRDEDLSLQAGQACADQIRTLAKGSRGSELLAIMYSDPYARMLEIVEDREYELMEENNGELGGGGSALSSCREIIERLFTLRADRLSDESLALPPTHFFIMSLLTGFILLGYTINVLPTVDLETGKPSNESAVIFGLLTTVYVIFYNFAEDLNNPFSGLYQIRRSSTAAHLLQAKWLLVNNPRTKGKIDFDEPENVEDVLIRTPGIGDMVFARGEIFPDDNSQIDEK